MISGKPLAARPAVTAPPIQPTPLLPPASRPAAAETRVALPERDRNRTILYERLTGEAARDRARQPEPRGAGLPAEIVDRIEYMEVWGTPNPPAGYDFRGYSFGGVLVASRSTRS